MKISRYEHSLKLPFSRMVRAGGFVFFAGQIPMDADGQVVRGDIKAQTHAVMARLRDSLELVNLDFSDVIKVTVWLTDLEMFADFNDAYAEYFKNGLPTRSTVQAGLTMGVDIEVEIQALDR